MPNSPAATGTTRMSSAADGKSRSIGKLLVHAVAARPFLLDAIHPRGVGLGQRLAEFFRRQRREAKVERREARTVLWRKLVDREHGRIAPNFRVLLPGLRLRRHQEIGEDHRRLKHWR